MLRENTSLNAQRHILNVHIGISPLMQTSKAFQMDAPHYSIYTESELPLSVSSSNKNDMQGLELPLIAVANLSWLFQSIYRPLQIR